MIGNLQLHEIATPVTGLAPITPSTSTPDYVCLKNFQRVMVVILVDNATTVTGSAITLKQATTVAAGGEKAIAFTRMWTNEDTAAGDTLTETAVTSNTFTTDDTDAKNLIYVMEVDIADLDVKNGFDCVRAGTADATAAVLSVLYLLYPARYGQTAGGPSAIVD